MTDPPEREVIVNGLLTVSSRSPASDLFLAAIATRVAAAKAKREAAAEKGGQS